MRHLLTAADVAERLGVSRQRVHQLYQEGKLAAEVETPLGMLYSPAEVQRLAEERAAKTNEVSA